MKIQLSLFNDFLSLTDFENNDKLKLLKLIEASLDFDSFFPLEIASKYYSHNGRNPYYLISMIKAFFVKNIYGYHSISMLIDLLNASPQVKAFCGFHNVPNKSKFSRFKKTILLYFKIYLINSLILLNLFAEKWVKILLLT